MSSVLFDVLLRRTVELCVVRYMDGAWIAIDGTGHSSWYASVCYGYAQRNTGTERQQRKRYTRNQIAVDITSQVIIAHRVARGPRHEAKDVVSLIRKTKMVHPVGYSMDKAYDSEEIRRAVVEEVRAACMIPLKSRGERRAELIGLACARSSTKSYIIGGPSLRRSFPLRSGYSVT
jgi:hypothetical protein